LIALQSLFDRFKVLDFISKLDDLNKHFLADYNNILGSLNTLVHKPSLDILAANNLLSSLKETTKGFTIQYSNVIYP